MRPNTVLIRLVFTGILIGAGYMLDPIGAAYTSTHAGVAQTAGQVFGATAVLWGLPTPLLSATLALLLAFAIILFEMRIQRASLKTLIGAAVGSMMGIIGGVLIGFLISYQEAGAVPPHTKV